MAAVRLPTALVRGLPSASRERLRSAWAYARKHLKHLPRRSGEDYATHGLEVARTLRELHEDPLLLCCALLHDLPVHPDGKELLEHAPVPEEGRKLIMGMHELRRLHIDSSTRDLDTAIEAFTEDGRLLLLRMAHRLNDVRHIRRFRPKLRREIGRETLHMYTAIAGRLGLHRWRYEMEDACFQIIHPRRAQALIAEFRRRRHMDENCLRQSARFLRAKLRGAGIRASVSSRIKGLYSTYRKMVLKRRRLDELTDRLALRIIVPTTEDCYRALGVVHAVMHPMPGKLKDYIGAPKENGYRSIHTVVFPLPGVSELPMEIQIRTLEMQHECDKGPLAHGFYKNWQDTLQRPGARVNLFRNLQTLRAEARSPAQFERALRWYFREDHIAVFDPKSNLYHLPKTSTALQFVQTVYPDRWKHLRGIRINGRERPDTSRLRDGDTVEALFAKTP